MNSNSSSYLAMDQCFPDVDFDQADDVSDPTSMLPFDFVDCRKSDMLMFFPQLGYDLHSPFVNQRKRTDPDKFNLSSPLMPDDLQVPTHHLVMNPSKVKTEPKITKHVKKQQEFIVKPIVSTHSIASGVSTDGSEKNRKIFYCRDCGKSFKFQTSLLRHNNKVHNCKYQCPTCHRVFSRQAYLDVHVSKPGSSCFINSYSTPRTRNFKI